MLQELSRVKLHAVRAVRGEDYRAVADDGGKRKACGLKDGVAGKEYPPPTPLIYIFERVPRERGGPGESIDARARKR